MTYDTSGIQQEGGQGYLGQEESVREAQYRKGERGKKGIARSPIDCPCCGKSFVIAPGKSLKTRFCSVKCGSNNRPKDVISNEKKKCMTCHSLVGMTGAASGRILKMSKGQIAVFRKTNDLPRFTGRQAANMGHARLRGEPLPWWGSLESASAWMSQIKVIDFDWSNHPVAKAQRSNAHMMRRYNTDMNFRLRHNLRGDIRQRLKRNNGVKAKKTEGLLGCTISQFRVHLESTFEKWMTWENYGSEWEVDHIIPASWFNLTIPEQQSRCWHFSNLRALSRAKNRSRGNRAHPQFTMTHVLYA